MSDRHADSKTNIDNLFFPSWIFWACFWPGLIGNMLFLFTLCGWQPPTQDVYFSPTTQAKLIRSLPRRFMR